MPKLGKTEPLVKPINFDFHLTPSKLLYWLVGIFALAGTLWFAFRASDIDKLFVLLQRVDPVWVAVAAACQLATYLLASFVWRLVLARAGRPLRLGPLFKMGFLQLFVNQILPTSGLSGTIMMMRSLLLRGVEGSIALSSVIFDTVSYYAVYSALTIVIVFLIVDREMPGWQWVPALIAFVALSLVVIAVAFWFACIRKQTLPRFLLRWRPVAYMAVWYQEMDVRVFRDTVAWFGASIFQFGVFLLDAATLWCLLRSLGISIDPLSALAGFMIASVVATLTPFPMGLGSFESAFMIMLHLVGVETEVGLASTLMLRAMTLWLPMIPGLALMRLEILRQTDRAA